MLSSWYTRKELALRTSILYAGSLLSGGFGGLIGAGVQHGLDGARGIPSWRWLFIIEAAITVSIAIIALFILPDFPHTTKFLSGEEKAMATRRLETPSGQSDAERGPLFRGTKMALLDYKVWLLALIVIYEDFRRSCNILRPNIGRHTWLQQSQLLASGSTSLRLRDYCSPRCILQLR